MLEADGAHSHELWSLRALSENHIGRAHAFSFSWRIIDHWVYLCRCAGLHNLRFSATIVVELHSIPSSSDINFTGEAHLGEDKLSYDTKAVKLVQLILEHLIRQLKFIYIFIECKEIIIAPAHFLGASHALFHWSHASVLCGGGHGARFLLLRFEHRVTGSGPFCRWLMDILCRSEVSAMWHRLPRWCCVDVAELAQMDRHFALLADLHEEKLAHADVVGFCYWTAWVKVDSIGR